VTDPDPILQQKGFTYAWTVTKSGANFASGTTASPTFTPDDNAKYVVTVTATDKAGHRSAPATATIIVDNVAPTVAVTGAPDIAQAGTAVSLGSTVTDPSTVDTATGFTYAWSVTKNGAAFGTGTRANFTFTPDTAATYVVTLTATDKDGGAGTDSHTIQVGSGGSTAPTVTITGTPASGHSPEGTTIALGTKVTDPDPILQQKGFTYAWTVTKSGANFASGTTASPTFTPDDNATYVVAVTATDKAGHQSAPTTATIIVDNVAPTAMITGSPGQSTPGTLITLGSSVTDPSTVDTATGFTYTWNVTKNGAAFASGSTSGISFTPDTAATYVATLTVADKDGGVGTDQQTIFVGTITANGNLILLPPAELAQLRSEALANTPQWQAFKARLDQNLPKVLTISSYEGSELTWISDYALGYQVLMNIDPTTAANYADKALGLMKTGLSDYQVSSEESRILLARGDGSTTTFALPNPDLIPSSVMVYVGPVTTVAVVRGAPNTQDTLGSPFYKVLKVSNAPDGSPDYAQGTDWQRNPDLPADQIDWSLSGKEPAQGSTYYVTVAHDFQAVPVHFTLKGTTVTLATAPGTNQAVFTDYVYGTHSSNGSTLAYQETDAGDGGFNSIYRDTGYTSRYLGKHIAMGLDWLDGYVGFSSALKTQAINMLVRWSDYTRDHGYHANDPASNYGAGEYVSRVITALALANRSSQGPRLISEVLAYRQQNALPLFNNATTSLNGGFYDEGWNYGQLASENIILAGLALEDAGQIPQATAERHWASQVIEHLVSAQSTAASVYDGGDWYAYPSPFPGKSFMSILSNVADDPVAQSYANYILQNYSGKLNSDYRDMLYRNPSAPTSFWSALPLQDMAQGTGLLTARSDWGSSPVWVSAQFNNLLSSSHQPHTPGMMEINRGADQLLINGNAPGGNQDFRTQAQFANTVVVDDNGEGKQNYRYGMGVWYGTPGVTVNAYEANANDVYMYGDYHVAYSNNRNPGGGGSVSELTRQVVYLRPDYVVVYDRVTTLKDYYPKQLRWHFLNAPTVSGNSFVETAGSSKLFGQTFSMSSLTTTSALVKVQGATIQQIITQNSTNAQSVRYVTAFQVASSTTTSMVATQQILSTDLRMEGVQMADQVVLFGRNGDVDPATPETYQISGTAPVHHLLTNMQAGRTYQIMANGALVATVTASSQGTLSFTTTPSGTQTITVV
jgi:PKD repeat protein